MADPRSVPPSTVDRLVRALERGDGKGLYHGYNQVSLRVQRLPPEEGYNVPPHLELKRQRAVKLQKLLGIAVGWYDVTDAGRERLYPRNATADDRVAFDRVIKARRQANARGRNPVSQTESTAPVASPDP